jgi:phosphohistidine phosphatase
MDEAPDGPRELLLLRHAKSAWDDPSAADHDRDLAPRGVKAAKRMGHELVARGLVPDLVLCSTARRARRTLELVLRAFDPAPPVRELRSLYLAPPSRLLEVVQRQPPSVRRLMLVGHDPGMHALGQRLAGRGPADLLASLAAKFPTGACLRLGFTGRGWDEVAAGRGRLLDFIRPRDLD